QERVSPELESKYKEELNKMFTEKLSVPKSIGTFILAGLRLLIGLAEIGVGVFDRIPSFVFPSAPCPLGIPFVLRFLLVAVGLFLILMSLKGLDLVRRGEMDRSRDVRHMAWLKSSLGWTSSLLFVALGLTELIARREQIGMILITGALVLLVISALPLLFSKINQADLDTRQKLLEIELRLAALDERLQGGAPKP
ncbi:hypothetical protein LLH00_09345, partial [bacterium]|nr:hypothetical protein [bacterium]